MQEVIRAAPKKPERSQGEIDKYLGNSYLDNLITTAIDKYALKGILVSDKDHMARARKMREMERPDLRHYRDDFMDWVDGAYRIIDDLVINAGIYSFLDVAVTIRGDGKKRSQVPFQPNRASVGETLAALEAVAHLDTDIEMPCWIDGRSGPLPENLIAFPNGLLDVQTKKLLPLNSAFFTTASLGFCYVDKAPEPENWLKFLNDIYAGEGVEAEIILVQEIFGYLLTGDASLEKMIVFLGPRRSGKGTMIRVLVHLLARCSWVGPTLRSLDTTFGMQPLIGKQVAIFDDVRLGKEQGSIVENLLKLTGRGLFTFDRKFKLAWSGVLSVKPVMISNLLPAFKDESGALASRSVISKTRVSFYDREEVFLFRDKLQPELLGIFHWALVGLQRLRKNGRFSETEDGKEEKDQLGHLGSPVLSFITQCCEFGDDASIAKTVLFQRWQGYRAVTEAPFMAYDNFFNALYAAAGGKVHSGRHRDKEKQKQVAHVFGIDLKHTPTAAEIKANAKAAQPDLLDKAGGPLASTTTKAETQSNLPDEDEHI